MRKKHNLPQNLIFSEEIDINKLSENSIRRKKPQAISSYMMNISKMVRPLIRGSKDPKSDLMKLRPMLQLADEASYIEDVDYLEIAKNQIKATIRDIKKYREKDLI